MSHPSLDAHINTNPLAFEELAMALASLLAFQSNGSMHDPIDQYSHLYTDALREPLGYREITELTGNGLDAGDRRAGRAAWLLLNTEKLNVVSVHSVIWHKIGGKFYAPILDQLSRALRVENKLSADRLQKMGDQSLLLDVAGVKDGEVWLVQAVLSSDVIDSAVKKFGGAGNGLFRPRVFNDPMLSGKPLQGLYMAYDLARRAFPGTPVHAVGLAMHPKGPDFELYRIEISADRPVRVVLRRDWAGANSLAYVDRLQTDDDALLALPHRLDDDSFKCVPPCRGGRTLALLAATAKRQMAAKDLLLWKEQELRAFLKDDYSYGVTRDKVRHDLVDRLIGQGFMRKWGSQYYLTVKGIARYQYCLAKYTTLGTSDPLQVLDRCTEQRHRIFNRFGYVI